MSFKSNLLKIYNAFPQKYHRLFDNYNNVHDFYLMAQHWSLDQVEAWQLDRLQGLVKMAYYQTSGYKQLFDEAHIKPEDIQSLEDIKHIPFTDKELIRSNVEAFTVRTGRLSKSSTSGSTGTPFVFFSDRRNGNVEYSFMDSLWESNGWDSNDRGLKIRGGLNGDNGNIHCRHIGYHRYMVSSQYLNSDNYEAIKSYIYKYRITYLHVYPSTISELASMIINHGEAGHFPIRHIFVGSEKFYTWQYEITRRAFPEARIVHWYGHSERAIWAPWNEVSKTFSPCPFYGMTEVVDKEGNQCKIHEEGELVGTSFWMRGTFFIRYKTGDRAILGDMNGNQITLDSIEGRKQDIVVDKTGQKMSLTVFDGWAMHGDFFSNVKLFRFVQKEEGNLLLKIVPRKAFVEYEWKVFQEKITLFFGEKYKIDFQIVDDLPRSKSGKFPYLEQYLQVNRVDNKIDK